MEKAERLNELIDRGLTQVEAKLFYDLLMKIKLPEDDIANFNWIIENDPIPFEAGMGFSDALTGLKISCEL